MRPPAAEQDNVDLAKLLTVFSADLKAATSDGKTPLDIAPRGGDCAVLIQNTIQIMDTVAAIKVSDTFKRVSIPRNSTFLLALDGGAAKSLITLQILTSLQKANEATPTRLRPHKVLLRLHGGTSAGSLIALGFGYRDAPPELLTGATFQLSQYVVKGETPYSSDAMEKTLKETLGDAKMNSIQNPRIIITTVLGDLDPPTLHVPHVQLRRCQRSSRSQKSQRDGSVGGRPCLFSCAHVFRALRRKMDRWRRDGKQPHPYCSHGNHQPGREGTQNWSCSVRWYWNPPNPELQRRSHLHSPLESEKPRTRHYSPQ